MSLPKPVMRGMLAKRLRILLPLAFASVGALGVVYHYTVSEPRKRAYSEFYKTYDDAKAFEAMREAGVFESVRPSGK